MEVNKQSLKLKASFLFLVCLFVVGAQASNKFKYCYKHGSNYEIKVQTVDISPFPVDPNQPWTFNVTGTFPGEPIFCGQQDILILIDYASDIRDTIKIHVSTCDFITFDGSTSTLVFSHTQPPRINVKPRKVTLMIEDDNVMYTCIEFKIKSKTESS